MIAKENLAFTKMKPLCELEECHGVDLGQGCKNNQVVRCLCKAAPVARPLQFSKVSSQYS